uniref:Putative secreted protein n=1 Tax=Ixodes ricinus TaxID=34613 RepID=V5I299_IXORI
MILTLSVVLLATFDYIHATHCNTELGDYMTTKCSSSKLTFGRLSECSFTCTGKNSIGQAQTTAYNLVNGLPCGPCQECCNGKCTPVKFGSKKPVLFAIMR